MRVDLHVHTSPKSSCSVLQPEEAVREAARLGLDAVCLTAMSYATGESVNFYQSRDDIAEWRRYRRVGEHTAQAA